MSWGTRPNTSTLFAAHGDFLFALPVSGGAGGVDSAAIAASATCAFAFATASTSIAAAFAFAAARRSPPHGTRLGICARRGTSVNVGGAGQLGAAAGEVSGDARGGRDEGDGDREREAGADRDELAHLAEDHDVAEEQRQRRADGGECRPVWDI